MHEGQQFYEYIPIAICWKSAEYHYSVYYASNLVHGANTVVVIYFSYNISISRRFPLLNFMCIHVFKCACGINNNHLYPRRKIDKLFTNFSNISRNWQYCRTYMCKLVTKWKIVPLKIVNFYQASDKIHFGKL